MKCNKASLKERFVSDAGYAALIEENLAEYQIAMAKVLPGGLVHDEPDVTWVVTDKPYKMYNGVYRSSMQSTEVDNHIVKILDEFQLRKVPAMWQLRPSTSSSNLEEHLRWHGFTHDEDEPGMALELARMNDDFDFPSGLEIRRAIRDEELNQWVSVWAYDAPDHILRTLQLIHHELGVGDDKPWRYYVGFLGGKPVATSLLFLGSAVSAVHWVVTIPSARKLGIGAAMTLQALRDARNVGYEVSILTASPFGAGIYKRIGFQEYCTIRKYEWKPD